jgi:hypothetical protein
MENRVSLHYALKWFFIYSEKLVGSLFKIGQGKSMSIFQKRANKFFRSFLCGPEKVGHFIIIVSKKLRFTHLNDIHL